MPLLKPAIIACCALTWAGAAIAGGKIAGGEPIPSGPYDSFSSDRQEANAEALMDNNPYGSRTYWQDGRGGRGERQFGPGYYQEGYYYPADRHVPNYWDFDERRAGENSLWGVVAKKVVKPFIPTRKELKYVGDLAKSLAPKRTTGDWAGGQYDRPLK